MTFGQLLTSENKVSGEDTKRSQLLAEQPWPLPGQTPEGRTYLS